MHDIPTPAPQIEARRFLTTQAVEIVGEAHTGQEALGLLDMLAPDLVLLDADPLLDVGNTRRVASVVSNGRYLDRTTLDALLARDRGERRQGMHGAAPRAYLNPRRAELKGGTAARDATAPNGLCQFITVAIAADREGRQGREGLPTALPSRPWRPSRFSRSPVTC